MTSTGSTHFTERTNRNITTTMKSVTPRLWIQHHRTTPSCTATSPMRRLLHHHQRLPWKCRVAEPYVLAMWRYCRFVYRFMLVSRNGLSCPIGSCMPTKRMAWIFVGRSHCLVIVIDPFSLNVVGEQTVALTLRWWMRCIIMISISRWDRETTVEKKEK